MNILKYNYGEKMWRPCPTAAEGDCFFHAAFGTREGGHQAYFDKYATFRRMYWSTFLIYFLNGGMTSSLLELIQKCFIANDKYQYKRIDNFEDYTQYIKDVAISEHWVLVEEIPILATLENIRIVLFIDGLEEPEVLEPNPDFLSGFPFRSVNTIREVVICLVDNHFSRLQPYTKPTIEDQSVSVNATYKTIANTNKNNVMLTPSLNHKKTYKKLGSAGIEGSLYQINLLTMFLLNGLRKFKNWWLSTEHQEAGKFDDLVFEFLPSESVILLQAKHKQSETWKITYQDLISTNPRNDDFSLPKYFFSYQEVRNKFKIQNIVICTNAKLDDKLKNILKEQSVSPNSVLHFEGTPNRFYSLQEIDKTFFTDIKQNMKKYYVEKMPDTKVIISDEDIDEFLSYLQLFPNYLCEEYLDNIVKETIPRVVFSENVFKLSENTNLYGVSSKDIFNDIHNKMVDWFKGEKGRYLTQIEAKAFLCNLISNKYCEIFKLYDISLEIVSPPVILQRQPRKSRESKRDRRQNKKPLPLPPKRILHIIPVKEYTLSVIKIHQVLQEEHKSKALYVNLDESPNNVQERIIDAFVVPHYMFLVIVAPKTIEKSRAREIYDNVMKILNDYKYKSVILIAEDENELTTHIKNADDNIYETVVDKITFTDLTAATQENFKFKRNIIFQGNSMSLEELFTPLVNEDLNQIVDSDILVKLARDEQIEVGPKLKDLDNYYITRSFNRNNRNIPERTMCEPGIISEEKVILISDSAGMGKSTVLTSLAFAMKKNYPHLWVVRIDLNSYTNIMKEHLKQGKKSISIVQLLNSQPTSKLKSDFESKLFLEPERIVLMLDGVDEVNPGFNDLIIKLLKDCLTQANLVKILVTTRPHLCEDLEQTLKAKCFTLEPFSEDNQTDFLTRYWTEKLDIRDVTKKKKCEIYAKALIRKMSHWINEDAENRFAGIPLQTRMLAEVFQEKSQTDDEFGRDWEECKEFLSSDEEELKLPKRINLIQLYEMFIDKKRDIFLNVKSNPSGNPTAEEALKEKFEECHQYHRSLALAIMFYSDECKLFTCYKEVNCSYTFAENYLLKAGIVQLLGSELHFIHRTFAEYFAAECVLLELRNLNENEKFREFFINEVLIREQFFVVRAFLDSFLQKELHTLPDDTFKAYSSVDYTSILASRNTYLHLFAAEGCAGILSFFVKCIDFAIADDSMFENRHCLYANAIDLDCNTPLHIAAYRGHLNVIKILVDCGADVNRQDSNGITAIRAAVPEGYLDVVEFLVGEAGANINTKNTYNESLLQTAAENGHLNLVKFFKERGVDNANEYTTALHAAAYRGHLEVVTYLIDEAGLDVNVIDINGCTPLFAAAQHGHLSVVKFLMDRGCDINIVNNDRTSSFHAASYRLCMDVVYFLMDRGADVTIQDEDGDTILDMMRILREGGHIS